MATLGGRSSGYRHPSQRGRLIVQTWRGKLIVRSWPRKATTEEKRKSEPWREWFRRAALLCKYVPAEDQIRARELTEGTPLMPRDILIAAMAGRLVENFYIDGQRYVSMSLINDLTELLDLLGSEPGTVLYRGENAWAALSPGVAGQVLTSNGPGLPPTWEDAAAAPPPAEPEPTQPTIKRWRVKVLSNGGGFSTRAREIEFMFDATSPDLAVGGIASAQGYYSTDTPAMAFDDDPATWWRDNTGATWIAYEFPDPVAVNVMTWQIEDTTNVPVDFDIESSADGATWNLEWSERGVTWSSFNQKRVFTRPEPTV